MQKLPIGEVLKRARLAAGLSQRNAAKKADMTVGQISQLETGARPTPAFSTVAKLAAALGTSLDALAAECGVGPAISGKPTTSRAAGQTLRRLTAAREHAQATLDQIDGSIASLDGSTKPSPRGR